MKVAAIILNYNSSADCRKCVGFLQNQRGVELEIIIVDNASRVDEATAAKELCEENGLTFLPSKQNRGYNAGNNIGLRYAAEHGYEYALIANPDMEFPSLDYVARLAQELNAHPAAIAVASDIVTPEGIHQNPMLADGSWTGSFAWIGDILGRRKRKDAYDFIGDYANNHDCAKLSGCALMVRVADVAALGFFDEYPFLYCEEAIFAKQSQYAGKTLRYIADTQAVHRHISSAKGDPRPRFRHWLRSRLYFINRYAGYPWYGRAIARLSWRLYLNTMILAATIKNR